MDIEFLLVDVRSDHVMTHQDLLSILLQKYEYDKEVKMELLKEETQPNQDRIIAVTTTGMCNENCLFRTEDMYLKLEQLQALTVGSHIDLRDTFGRYLKAEIIETNGNKLKIHFVGWNAMWDRW
eukprot:65395_1